jgi:hypothetical protein
MVIPMLTDAAQGFLPPTDVPSFSHSAYLSHTPELYVTDLNIGSAIVFKAGDTINGNFSLYNNSSFSVSGITYELQVVSGLDSGAMRTYDVLKGSDKISLKPKEQKNFSFSYKIPTNINGSDIGILIQSRTEDGSISGWQVSRPLKVTGGLPSLSIIRSSIQVMGSNAGASSTQDTTKVYPVNSNPFIYKDAYPNKAFIQYVLANENKTDIAVIPTMEISDFPDRSKIIYSKTYNDASVAVDAAKESQSASLELPNIDWKPGIYAGIVSFKDKEGNDRADKIHFTYSVGGDVYEIQSVTSQQWMAKKHDDIKLAMTYSAGPFDMDQKNGGKLAQVAEVTVTLFNEKNSKVGEWKNNVDFLNSRMKDIVVNAQKPAKALRADVVVRKDGMILNKSSFNISPDYDTQREAYMKSFAGSTWGKLIMFLALVALVLLAAVIYKKRKYE